MFGTQNFKNIVFGYIVMMEMKCQCEKAKTVVYTQSIRLCKVSLKLALDLLLCLSC